MAKERVRGWRKWVPSKELVVRVGVALVAYRIFTRYVILPYQSKLPKALVDFWPTPWA